MNLAANITRQPVQLSLLTERKHEAAYREHRRAHPEVFERLVALARDAKARGWTRIGMRTLWEVLRWRRGAKPTDATGFHMNDWYAPFYARDIMRECDDLAGMFETRERWNNDFTALAARALMRLDPSLVLETRTRKAEQKQEERAEQESRWTGELFA